MKLTIALLFFSSLISFAEAIRLENPGQEQSPLWTIGQPGYGQFRIVPSRVIPHVAEVRDWQGPWKEFENFILQIGFSEGRQTTPREFNFVDPSISLQGSALKSVETSGTSVRLFDRESTKDDIIVTFKDPPRKVEFDQEYHSATICGSDSIVEWQVFIRFLKEKPNYIQEAKSSKK